MSRRRAETRTIETRDAGFTLVEMLIVVMMTGVVAVVIAAAVIVSFRTFPDVEDRADTAITLQGLTTWLPPDVDSANPGQFDTSTSALSGCTGADPGVNLLRLSWEETAFGKTTSYVANYRFVVSGLNYRIKRVSCSGTSALGAAQVRDVTGALPATTPTVTPRDTDGDLLDDTVTFSIVTLAGTTVDIDAASKNPHETIPPAPTTTTATPVNSPPTSQNASTSTTELTSVDLTLPAGDPDGDLIFATVQGVPAELTVTISGLVLTITPAAGTLGSSFTFQYTMTDPDGASATADVTVEVTDGSAPTTTSPATTTTQPPCVLGSMELSDDSMPLKKTPIGKLQSDVIVEITITSGYCVGLTLQYETDGSNEEYVQNFGESAPYTVTLEGHPKGTELWGLGAHELSVYDGARNMLGSRTLTTTT